MNTAENAIEQSWETVLDHDDYEINTAYPYPIRRIGSDRIISESIDGHGYVQCMLMEGCIRSNAS